MPPALRVLCAACVLCALCATSATTDDGNDTTLGPYCSQLRNKTLVSNPEREQLALSELGLARRVRLAGGGAAPRAAHQLLRALLLHALLYRHQDLALDHRSALSHLARPDQPHAEDEFILSVASAWSTERAGTAELACERRVCGVAGTRLSVLARDAAPVARRLHARLAPLAPGARARAACLHSWDALRDASCGFLHHDRDTPAATPDRSCVKSTCTPDAECVTVMLGADEDEAGECGVARALASSPGAPPLRFAWLPDETLRAELDNRRHSFLFVDYDLWADGAEEGVLPAPLLLPQSAAQSPVSLVVADVRRLTLYAPAVLQLAVRFRPPPAMLRRQLAEQHALGREEAACKAALSHYDEVSGWLECDSQLCDPVPIIRVYICTMEKYDYYLDIREVVFNYWESNFNPGRNGSRELWLFPMDCSDVNKLDKDVGIVIYNFTSRARLAGIAAMGGVGASPLPATARAEGVPLLLVAPVGRGEGEGEGARSTAPPLRALAAAARRLLARCGWTRVALLWEEGSCGEQKRSLGLYEELSGAGGGELEVRAQVVQAGRGAAEAALDWVLLRDARVVLVDASAQTAAQLLRAAQRRHLAPDAGYMWLVLGNAGDAHDQDWWPDEEAFWYVTVSGGWRGGAAPRGLGGAARLREELEAALGAGAGGRAWSPHAAALADAMLLLLEGTARVRRAHPERRHDPQHPDSRRLFFELLNNISAVTHEIRANASPPVFVHRWSKRHEVELVGVWNETDYVDVALERKLPPTCGGVRDRAACRTTSSGDRFTPHCHDVAWAVLACVLALGPPALCAAHVARRRRLRRHDRRVEERVLLRGGHSAAEAAAAAALAEHAVPRASLRLLDDLGGGHYGVVRRAVLRRAGSAALAVAAKATRADAPAGAASELLREAALLASLRHEHVVRFAGVCLEGGPLVLMDHAFHGDLRRYLRARRPLAERARVGLAEPEAAHVAAPALTRLAREAAAALGYLARRRVVHRDVRAANCLVDERRSLKLADFGMARRLGEAGAAEYLCRRRAMFPVLWMAPESLDGGVFSPATDVWALGVLVLELATLGERPFGAWAAPRVLRHVRAGGVPPLPRDAATCTRGVTAACWRRAADERPSAAELVAYLAEHPRAVQPALELLPGTDADADVAGDAGPDLDADAGGAPTTPDSGVYIDEWT